MVDIVMGGGGGRRDLWGGWIDTLGRVGHGVGFLPRSSEPDASDVTQYVILVEFGKLLRVTCQHEELTSGLSVRDKTELVLAVLLGTKVENPICTVIIYINQTVMKNE